MCGLAGIIQTADLPCAAAEAVDRMCAAMRHRGPDDSGAWASADGLAALGHTRLAVLDVSPAGHQPVISPDGRHVLIYNGECYNFRELRRILEAEGRAFRSSGDSEVVLQWLAARGAPGLAQLRGMFALALWDGATRSLLLARDRFGIKPLYYAVTASGALTFASEVRALLASGLVERRADPSALAAYLLYGFTVEPETIVAGVRALPAGNCLRAEAGAGGPRLARLADEPPASCGPPPPEEVRAAFLAAVESHLVSDVPIGAFLSGGVDSSAVVGAMSRLPGVETRTLTVTFPDAVAYSEGRQAAQWAAACGARHQEVPVTGADLLAMLPHALGAQDQPTTDGVNTYVVSRAARGAGLTVALSGLGGDELFGGYPTFRDVPRSLLWRRALGPAAPALAKAVDLCACPFHRRPAKVSDLLRCPADLPALYAARRRLFSPQQCRALLPEAQAFIQPHLRVECPAGPSSSSPVHLFTSSPVHLHPLDAVSALDQSFYMRNQLLRDSDFMSMACSLEIRVPFLDARFAAAAWAAGPRARDGKRFFVRALEGLVPRDILDRPKRGFTMPFKEWMLGPLRRTVEDRLRALPPAFDSAFVLGLWREFLRRPDQVGWSRPWALFVLGAYLADNRLRL